MHYVKITMSKAFLHRQAAMGLTLILGIGLSILATAVVSRWEASNRQLRFQRQIENLGTALQRNINRYTDLLAFLSDYYTVEQSQIDRQSFAQFVGRSLQTYSGIQALEWAPLVRQADRLTYEQRIAAEGYAGFNITELERGRLVSAAQRPSYIPVTYVEPFTGNEAALGYDLSSHPTRAAAINQAINTGAITATGRIRLVQENRDQYSFLMFLPIYQNRQIPSTLALRRQQFTEVVLGVFRVSDVVEESLQGLQSEINFTIYDHSANPAEQFLGYYDATQKQVTTLPDEFFPAEMKTTLCPSSESCTQTLSVGQRQWSIVFSPSSQYWIETQHSAIATLITGLLLTGGLVMFLHQLNRELEQTQSLSNLRSRFFSMASHELRTPLSTLLLSSESLQTNYLQLTEAQKQTNIQRIYVTAKQMSQQLADLLTFTRAEVGKLEFHPELLNMEHCCQQVVEEMQLGIKQPILFTSRGITTKAFLDKTLLRSLLTNLLSNAAKYSPADAPIHLTLDCNATTAILQVCDRGIGIPTADQARIWEAFCRGSNVGEATGTGLGLAIVKTCVEMHRGSWQVESEVGTGTTITVQLPLE